jgi:hypothetical protein
LGGLLLNTSALAQDEDDDPYAYPDEEPSRSEPTGRPSRGPTPEGEEEDDGDFERLSGLDDPNIGLAFELISGALLLDSSRGALTDPRLGLGARATWEFGRLFDDERLRESLWADVRWTYTSLSAGTEFISTSTKLHYFTLAPAYELKLGQSSFGFYAQAGGGVAYQLSSLTVDNEETPVNGIKPLIQYGVGFRGRPQLGSSRMHLSFRLEAVGFRRGYMNDFFLGGSLGTAF